ncbi:MAG: Two-component system sensor histidine kinase [Firmicutes bacterium]|nr:Two-component system sensor histidine kinase [Bacillota bacterium]
MLGNIFFISIRGVDDFLCGLPSVLSYLLPTGIVIALLNILRQKLASETRKLKEAREYMDISHPQDMQKDLDKCLELIEGKRRSFDMEKRYIKKDGGIVWTQISRSLAVNSAGKPLYYLTYILDITGRKQAEENLRHSEERYRTLVELLPDAVIVCKGETIVFANSSAVRTIGAFDSRELIGRSVLGFLKCDGCKDTEEMEELLRRGEMLPMERTKLKRIDGKEAVVDLWATEFHDRDFGETVLMVIRDVTESERIRAEASLQRAYFQQLFENSPQAIAMVDNGDRIVNVNKGFERMFGYSPEEVKGCCPNDIVVPEGYEKEAEKISRMGLSGKTVYKESRRKRKDGTALDVSILTYPIVLDGEQVGSYVIYSDIRKRKKAETALRESQERYRKLVDIAPYGILVISRGNIVLANKSAVDVLGVNNENAFLGRHVLDFIHPEYRQTSRDRMETVQEKGIGVPPMEIKLVRENGEVIDVEVITIPFPEKGENKLLCVVRDITGRKQAATLQQEVYEKDMLLREAAEYERLRNEFFANISHELRTPLTLMFTTLQVLERWDDINRDKISRYIKVLKQNCLRLLRLINNLIDITKIDSGFYELCLQNHNIVSIVENVVDSVAEFVQSKDIELVFDTEVEEKITACDPDKIERIMLNLLSNAVKFTKPGGRISVNVYDGGEDVRISIRDTGIGIPEDMLELIFERFRQVDGSFTRDHEGSGIGLSLVKSLAEMHGGGITVKSEAGKGSEFIINLPVRTIASKCSYADEYEISKDKQIERINIEFSDIYS